MLKIVYDIIIEILYPLFALIYRLAGSLCPNLLLRFFGICTGANRPNLCTVSKILIILPEEQGAIAECGVYKGKSLLGIAHTLKKLKNKRMIFGMDSFEGLPEPSSNDAKDSGGFHKRALKGYFSDTSLGRLKRRINLLGFGESVTLVKGYFEETLPRIKDEVFVFVHLDCDIYDSYKQCLEFFYPKMVTGGFIVFDEYSFSKDVYPGAQKAIDEFMDDKPEKIQSFDECVHKRYFIIKN